MPPTIFESLRIKDHRLPLLERHLERLESNRRVVQLAPLPEDLSAVLEEEARSGPSDGLLRVEWSNELWVSRRDLPGLDPVRLITSRHVHVDYAIKTTDREVFDRARAEAEARGADGAVLLTGDGYVAEGSHFALAWLEGKPLRVPSLDLGILPSIGRSRVMEVAREEGLDVEAGSYVRDDLDGRAMLIVTAVRGVVPVLQLDGAQVPQDERITLLAERFWPSA